MPNVQSTARLKALREAKEAADKIEENGGCLPRRSEGAAGSPSELFYKTAGANKRDSNKGALLTGARHVKSRAVPARHCEILVRLEQKRKVLAPAKGKADKSPTCQGSLAAR